LKRIGRKEEDRKEEDRKEGRKEGRKRMERAVKGDGRFCDILHVHNVLYSVP
jgi:hypothetical protein